MSWEYALALKLLYHYGTVFCYKIEMVFVWIIFIWSFVWVTQAFIIRSVTVQLFDTITNICHLQLHCLILVKPFIGMIFLGKELHARPSIKIVVVFFFNLKISKYFVKVLTYSNILRRCRNCRCSKLCICIGLVTSWWI